MTRIAVLGITLLSIALVACGGSKRRHANTAEHEDDEGGGDNDIVVIFTQDMGSKAYNMPKAFAVLSRKHGCKVNEKPTMAISVCEEGVIGLGREGTIVRVACDNRLTQKECQNLFAAIAAEGDEDQ